MASTLRQRIEATTRSFLATFEDGAKGDASVINRDVTEDCKRYLLPASVPRAFNLPEDFAFDPKAFQGTYENDLKVLKFNSNVIANLVIDTEALRAAFTSLAEVEVLATGETYPVEQSWYLYFTEDGSKVNKVIEFCDKDALVKMASASA
ncbi:hypothetical protein F5X68DRAFT_253278 [Plectosphaerella plurivora]|uniref:SnoaL-like domain-containing protein n=1 Tax=Plectosphaerella plurivora TaxID=936078 RepID=A0A9P8VHC4_9PEZI|nr:hypothetical protein F5X68DRAFT_253278 [Plectosphaerella plurivora]